MERFKDIIDYKNVVAVGESVNGIEVSVEKKLPEDSLNKEDIIPKAVDGYKTNVTETGVIRALSYTKRRRPAPGGISIGHFAVTAGTLGMWITKEDEICVLSNNHILANKNNAKPGDRISQPGPLDSSDIKYNEIANLTKFIPIIWKSSNGGGGGNCPFANALVYLFNKATNRLGCVVRLKSYITEVELNLVDCAIAKIIDPGDALFEILDIGVVNGTSEGTLGMHVEKTGRTTGHTQGTISQVNVIVDVSYGGGQRARFTDQLLSNDSMSQGGDSGSILVNSSDKTAVGLLFAGGQTTTIFNRIQNVEAALEISI